MKRRRAFSLIEVLITVVVLSTAIIFVFRAFATSLASVKFSQNIVLGCYLAEEKLWEIEQRQKNSLVPIGSDQGSQELQGRRFKWASGADKLEDADLIDTKIEISWQERAREKEYQMNFSTYLLAKK